MVDETVVVPFENDDPRLMPPQQMINPPKKTDFKTPLPKGIIPFPIHSRLGIDTEMWVFGFCPKASTVLKTTLQDYSDELAKSESFMSLYKEVLGKLKLADNWEEEKPLATRCFELADFIIMDNKNSNDPVIPYTYDKAAIIRRCYDLTIIGTYKDMDVAKAAITPILNQIKVYFEKKTVADKSKQIPLKYVQYSGHDDTLGGHMRVYGMAEPACMLKILMTGVNDLECVHHPWTSSNMIWELIEGIAGTEEYGVKFSYNGDYFDYCKTGKTDKSGDFYCTLPEFYKQIDTIYTIDTKDYCDFPNNNPKSASNNTIVYILIALVSILLVAVIALGFKVSKLTNAKNVRYFQLQKTNI